jgi:hypothetical protein
VLKECRESLVDTAEKKLYEMVEDGDYKAVVYVLSTLGRDRGWGLPAGSVLDQSTNNTLIVQEINIMPVPAGQYITEQQTVVEAA